MARRYTNADIMAALIDFRNGNGQRFEVMDRRFDDLEYRMNKRFDSVDLRSTCSKGEFRL
jgi:hypothetical protein